MLIEEFDSAADRVFLSVSTNVCKYFLRLSSYFHSGRNWYEFLRQYDALMMVIYHPVACPANWAQGQQLMIKKDVSTHDAADYRCVEIKPWFRLAPCPEKL